MRRTLWGVLLALLLLVAAPAVAAAQDADEPTTGGGFPSPLAGVIDGVGDFLSDNDCRTPPTPASPTHGAAYDLDPGPDNPRQGDPFAPNPRTTVYEKYGYGGLSYQRYDPGCVLDKLPGDAINSPATMRANMKFGWAAQLVALSDASGELLRDPQPVRDALDPLVVSTSGLLGDEVYYPLIGVAAVVLGIGLLWKSRDAEVQHVPRILGGAMLVLVSSAFFLNYPVWSLNLYWDTATTIVNGVEEFLTNENTAGADPGVAATADLHYNTLVRPYMAGLVCTSTGPAFDQYAVDLYRHSRFTFLEDRAYRSDPAGAGAELVAAKQAAWQEVADEIEQTDPAAYDCLQGELGKEQSQYATASVFLAGSLGGTQTVANVLLNVSLVFGGLLVAFFPAIAVIGLVRQDIAWAGFAKVGRWLLRALVLFGVTRVLTNLAGGLLARGLPPLVVAFLVMALIFGWVVWRVQKSRRVRRLMKEGYRVGRDYWRGRKSTQDALDDWEGPQEVPTQQPTRASSPPSPPPTTAPTWEGRPGTRIAGSLPVGPSVTWVPEQDATPRSHSDAAGWVTTAPPTETVQPEPVKPRVMDPGEPIPAGAVPVSYQRVHRPGEGV